MELKDSIIQTRNNLAQTRLTVDTNLSFLQGIYREYLFKNKLSFWIIGFLMVVSLIVLIVGIVSFDSKNGLFNAIPIICGTLGEVSLGLVFWLYSKNNRKIVELGKKVELLFTAKKQIEVIENSQNPAEIEKAQEELTTFLDKNFSLSLEK